jgi:hypothetical protein
MERLDDTARRLLREMGYQAEGNPSEATDVAPREAAESLDLDPRAPEYTAALNHLLALGFIEPKRRTRTRPSASTDLRSRASAELEKYVGGNYSSA